MKRLYRTLLLFIVPTLLSSSHAVHAQDFRGSETEAEKQERMAWWRDAKFGMFVHWGIYAAAEGSWDGKEFLDMRPGVEWLMCKGKPGGIDKDLYVKTLAPKTTLANFKPKEWAALAKRAGMKYFVITAKHHDGFGMVDFPYTDLDIADRTPYAKDPMLELSSAIREAGLKFGFYFSQSQDWSRPGARPHWYKGLEGDWNDYVKNHAVPQLRHLLGGTYGDISLLWFDSGNATKTQEGAREIWQELAATPDIIVNQRLKYGKNGDFDTPEQWIPPTIQTNKAWETCMTLNGSWGYNPTDPHWKTSVELIRNLSRVVSQGGNYLLNVGPRADGSWEPEVAVRLEAIGAWMDINSEAIYETKPNPLGYVRWGAITWKEQGEGSKLYCHVFNRDPDGTIRIPLANEVIEAKWLGSEHAITWRRDEDSLILDLSVLPELDPASSVLELSLEGQPLPLPLIVQPDSEGTISVLPMEASVQGGVHHHYRSPHLDGWHGRNRGKRTASWHIRVPNGGASYKVSGKYGFNAEEEPDGWAFQGQLAGQEIRIPVSITGVKPGDHNKENNQLVILEAESEEGVVTLPAGVHQLVVRADGAPEKFKKPKGRENKKLCYTAFAMLEIITLTPVQ